VIVTERLDLFHASVDLPAAELERLDRPVSRFAALRGVRVPESWPPDCAIVGLSSTSWPSCAKRRSRRPADCTTSSSAPARKMA
jgi:hypothetical protein